MKYKFIIFLVSIFLSVPIFSMPWGDYSLTEDNNYVLKYKENYFREVSSLRNSYFSFFHDITLGNHSDESRSLCSEYVNFKIPSSLKDLFKDNELKFYLFEDFKLNHYEKIHVFIWKTLINLNCASVKYDPNNKFYKTAKSDYNDWLNVIDNSILFFDKVVEFAAKNLQLDESDKPSYRYYKKIIKFDVRDMRIYSFWIKSIFHSTYDQNKKCYQNSLIVTEDESFGKKIPSIRIYELSCLSEYFKIFVDDTTFSLTKQNKLSSQNTIENLGRIVRQKYTQFFEDCLDILICSEEYKYQVIDKLIKEMPRLFSGSGFGTLKLHISHDTFIEELIKKYIKNEDYLTKSLKNLKAKNYVQGFDAFLLNPKVANIEFIENYILEWKSIVDKSNKYHNEFLYRVLAFQLFKKDLDSFYKLEDEVLSRMKEEENQVPYEQRVVGYYAMIIGLTSSWLAWDFDEDETFYKEQLKNFKVRLNDQMKKIDMFTSPSYQFAQSTIFSHTITGNWRNAMLEQIELQTLYRENDIRDKFKNAMVLTLIQENEPLLDDDILEYLIFTEQDDFFSESTALNLLNLKNNDNYIKSLLKTREEISLDQKNIIISKSNIEKLDKNLKKVASIDSKIQMIDNNYSFIFKKKITVNEFKTLINEDEMIIQYHLIGDKLFCTLISKDFFKIYFLDENIIRTTIPKYYEALNRPDSNPLILSQLLYSELVLPFENELSGTSKLIFIRDGFLNNLSFETLIATNHDASYFKKNLKNPEKRQNKIVTRILSIFGFEKKNYINQNWMIKNYEISYVPSLKSFITLREKKFEKKFDNDFLAFGNPVLNKEKCINELRFSGLMTRGVANASLLKQLCELPETEKEILSIANYFDKEKTKIFVGNDFTETKFKNLKKISSKIISFATHGVMKDEITEGIESALVATPPENPNKIDDGLLTQSEIIEKNIFADLVILSACNTGTNDSESSIKSLSMAFFLSGAKSILLSYRPIESTVATEISTKMVDYYINNNESLSGALRKSILNIQNTKDYYHPFYWSSFQLVGDSIGLN